MRPILILISFFTFLSQDLRAQTTVTGIVTDSLNVPVPFASVYLSKTTIGNMTNKDGAYLLTIPQNGEYELIASCIGYKTYSKIIYAEGRNQTINIKLSLNLIQVDEVTVQTKDKNRIKNYTEFTALFLGQSVNAQNCRILNTEDLYLRKEAQTAIIKGRSLKPLRIENRSLGYDITYDLTDFTFDAKTGFLRFSGNPYFQQLQGNAKDNKKWFQKRLRTYYGSRMHFLRSLYQDSLTNHNFKVSNFDVELTKNKSGVLSQKIIPVQENSLRVTREPDFMTLFSVRPLLINYYDNRPELSTELIGFEPRAYESTIQLSRKLKVFQNGHVTDPYSVTWGGTMADERIADMLPDDFQPYTEISMKQDSVIPASPIEKYLTAQQNVVSRDQLFVQLDRNIYRPGDTIYFQAYVRDRFTGNFQSGSVSLYALLYNEKKTTTDSARFRIDNATSSGWMAIPMKAETGKYHFTAFTSLMQNYDPADAFQLDLYVKEAANIPGNTAATFEKGKYSQDISPKAADSCFELKFLPEGGTYIEGLRQKVGFNATNARGEPVYIEGLLKNRDETVLDTIRSGHYGPGSFVCTALPGLYVELTRGAGSQKQWFLPAPAAEGISMSIKPIDNSSFAVEIQSDYYLSESVTVMGSMNLMQFFSQDLILNKKQRIVVVTDDLPSGIAEITLFNKELKPVAERLYAINCDKHLRFNIQTENKIYHPGQETEIEISVTDGFGNPAEGFFSIAVTDALKGIDAGLFAPGIEYAMNYRNYFPASLPPGVLAKGIEHMTEAERNLILMVYGWKKFNPAISNFKTADKQPENYDLLNIKILSSAKSRKAEKGLNLVSLEGPTIMHLVTNDSGEVSWPLDSLPNATRSVSVMPDLKDRNRILEAMLSIPYNEKYFNSDKLLIPQPIFLPDNYSSTSPVQNIPFEEKTIEIKEVTVVGHSGNKKLYQDKYGEMYQYTNVKSLEPEMLESSSSLETAIRKLVSPYKWTGDNIYLRAPRSFTAGPVPALFVLDGMPVYQNGWALVSEIPVSEITSLTIVSGQRGYSKYGDGSQGGVIFINTRAEDPKKQMEFQSKWSLKNREGNMLVPIPIYRPAVEFYSPTKLDIDVYPILQSRATILWKPEVYFNGKEPAKIKYNNLKHTGPVVITINGVSVNNLIGTGRAGYKIQ